MMWDMDLGIGMIVAMSLVWLVVVAGVVVGIAFLVRALSGSGNRRGDAGRSAVAILEERFARGDIDRKEYENRRRLLSQRAM